MRYPCVYRDVATLYVWKNVDSSDTMDRCICMTVATRRTMMAVNKSLEEGVHAELNINGICIGKVETLRWLELARHAPASG